MPCSGANNAVRLVLAFKMSMVLWKWESTPVALVMRPTRFPASKLKSFCRLSIPNSTLPAGFSVVFAPVTEHDDTMKHNDTKTHNPFHTCFFMTNTPQVIVSKTKRMSQRFQTSFPFLDFCLKHVQQQTRIDRFGQVAVHSAFLSPFDVIRIDIRR